MMSMGAIGVLAFQKYGKCMISKMECVKDSAIDMATDKLEKMK